MSGVELRPHQKDALLRLRNGSILWGGVGSGKSFVAIHYYYFLVCQGAFPGTMQKPRDLYIITTAKKRDSLEWCKECASVGLSPKPMTYEKAKVFIDSWQNISKYESIENAFFIFDEQRLVGSGKWVKSFLKIAKSNKWIILSATPGDAWIDYIPVFVANGFYKNRTQFILRHVKYMQHSKYPKIERYLDESHLNALRAKVLVDMPYEKHTNRNMHLVITDYDQELFKTVMKSRQDPETKIPFMNAAQWITYLRMIVNSHPSRLEKTAEIARDKGKIIVFYNFNYELVILRELASMTGFPIAEWNGHKHEEIPKTDKWIYLVQYTAGAEGWNCVETDTIVFYSLNHSYKIFEQSQGRIDRLNTPFKELHYYIFRSRSKVDTAIWSCLVRKKNFNESAMPTFELDGQKSGHNVTPMEDEL